MSTKQPKPSTTSADDLVKTTPSGKVELTEQELGNVVGGDKMAPVEYLKIKLTDVYISSYQ
jgi:hypothetical protein